MKKAIFTALVCAFLVSLQVALEKKWVKLKTNINVEVVKADSVYRIYKTTQVLESPFISAQPSIKKDMQSSEGF